MKIAVIDIGTNTARLAVFDVSNSAQLVIVHENNAITRLGGGLNETGRLSEEAMQRTLSVVKEFISDCENHGVEKIYAVGTQAIRIAENGADFIETLRKAGLKIEIITGETEGSLVFNGVYSGLIPTPGGLVTIDIGGGSTEICWGSSKIEGVKSFPIGSVVLKEKFFSNDPPTIEEIDKFKSYCEKLVEPLRASIENSLSGFVCAGVAGTVTTIAMIALELSEYDSEKVHGTVMNRKQIDDVAEKLLRMTSAQRLKIPGMQPGRADIIHAGGLIFSCVAKSLNVPNIFISEMDIRHGLARREIIRLNEDVSPS